MNNLLGRFVIRIREATSAQLWVPRGILNIHRYGMYVEYVGTDQGLIVTSNCMDLIAESKVLSKI